jgi:DNA-directed RNA polymerase specialized sigma24 family protein
LLLWRPSPRRCSPAHGTSPLWRISLGAPETPIKSAIDWKALRAHALQGVRRKLRFTPAGTIEDLAQEVMVTLFRLSQRERLVNPEALTTTLVHRVCVDHVRRMRGPTGRLDPLPDGDSPLELPAQDPSHEVGADMLELFRFVVLEHFKQHDAACHELATDFFAELSWSTVARRLQLRHNTVIKRWSRCMEQVRELAYSQRGPVWEWAREARIV